MDQAIVAWR